MQYIIKAYDGKDENALARRMAARPAHLENIKKLTERGCVLCAGGLTEAGKPIGSFLVMDFESEADFNAYLETEPYITANVWQEVKSESCSVVILNNERVGK